MSRGKIAVFIPSLRGGGAERAMIVLCEGLVALGFPVDLIVGSVEGPLSKIVPSTINLINLKKRRTISTLFPLALYLKRERPLALFSTIPHANIVALVAAFFTGRGLPVIVRESNSPLSEPKPTLSRKVVHHLVPLIYKRARAIIAVSEGVASELVTMDPSLTRLISVLPTPVVSTRLVTEADESISHPWFSPTCNEPVIVAAGRLHPQKDFAMLLRAFKRVRAHRPARLVILGEGALRKELELLATELGISDFVSMPGFVLNPFPYLKRASVFALSSQYEGMPNVLLQALALGTSVVATDCKSGPRECLNDGNWGRLVPVGDAEAMAQALLETLETPSSTEATAFINEHFSHVGAARSYLALAGVESEATFNKGYNDCLERI